jgi:hypothetical protein
MSFTEWPYIDLSEDRNSEQVIRFIDMKSKMLCDDLRKMLQDVRAISVIGKKLSVCDFNSRQKSIYSIFHYLLELKQAVE